MARWLVLTVLAGALIAGAWLAGRYWWAQYQFSRAKKELDLQRYEQARLYYNRGLNACPNDLDARIQAARVYRFLNDFRRAEEQLDACKGLDDPRGRLKLARQLVSAHEGDISGYETELTKRSEDIHDVDREAVLEVLASGYTGAGRNREAEETADKLLEIRPHHLIGLMTKAQVMYDAPGRGEDGVNELRLAVKFHPDSLVARGLLATALLQEKYFDEAHDVLEETLKIQPGQFESRLNLARCSIYMGRPEEAIPILDDLLSTRPHMSGLVVYRAIAEYRRDPASPDAESWLRRAHQAAPRDMLATKNLIECLYHNDPTRSLAFAAATACGGPAAFKAAEQLTEANRLEDELHNYVANYNELDRRRRLQSREKSSFDDLFEIARLSLEMGDGNEDAKPMLEILRSKPNYAPAHRALADFYERRGELNTAEYHRARAEKNP